MKHEDFEKVIESLPSYQRLAFIHGERLFNRDECGYRIVYLQALYELASRPTGIIVTSEKLSKQQREELLAELVEIDITAIGDGEPKQIRPIICSRGQQIWCYNGEHPDCYERLKNSDDEDHLTDGQVWVAIGIIILLILIISFSAFPSP
jgi:hypothetical protein